MEKKKAFVFDTNFIIQNKGLKKVVSSLEEKFTVYVTQISIDERIAKQCRDLREKYNNITKIRNEYRKIADITIVKTYEEAEREHRARVQTSYDNLFGSNIIPFSASADLFSMVLERAHWKTPPFSSADNSSDKGFKDTLIWLSLISFFKEHGEDSVIFISSDKGFCKNEIADILCTEFMECTGKTIEIKDNSYYRTLVDIIPIQETPTQQKIPDVSTLREKIRDTLESICNIVSEDYLGRPICNRTFTLNEKVDAYYMQTFFKTLKSKIHNHIFDISVPASDILELDYIVSNADVNIPISHLEQVLALYLDIQKQYPEYVDQFYLTSASIINKNYVEPSQPEAYGELPF